MINLKYIFRNNKVINFIILILLLYSVIHLIYTIKKYHPNINGDFEYQYKITKDWVEKEIPPLSDRYSYPYFYYLITSPLTYINISLVRYIVYFLDWILLIISIYLLTKVFSEKKISYKDWLLIFIISLNYWPALETLAQYKVEIIELFFISLAIYYFKHKNNYLVGAFITIATNLKYFPGVLLFYFFYKREKKIIISSTLTMIIIMIILISAFGFNTIKDFIINIPNRYSSTNNQGIDGFLITNVALTGALLKLFAKEPAELPSISNSEIPQYISLFLRLLIIIILAYLFRKKINNRIEYRPYIEINLVLLSIFFLSPYTLNQYAILILPVFIFFYFFIKNNWSYIDNYTVSLVILSYLFIGFFIPLGMIDYLPTIKYFSNNVYAVWWFSIPTIGFILLGIALIRIINYKKMNRLN